MNILTREDAIEKLKKLIGQDLRPLAPKFGVTVFTDENDYKGRNKGWAGQDLERYLGMGVSNLQAPNGGNWELKMVSLKLVICARLYNDINETSSTLISVGKFDLHDSALYAQVKKDYDLVRDTLRTTGFSALTGAIPMLS